jgi:hypothetical protein
MSFQIIEILDSQTEQVLAKINHGGNQITAIIRDKKSKGFDTQEPFLAEMDYEKILGWEVINDFDDAISGIWQEENEIHLLGRVHDVIDAGDGKSLIDVYMKSGPEFFVVNSESINSEIPAIDSGLKIIINTLYIYPSHK